MRRAIKSVLSRVPYSQRIINSPALYRYINVIDAIRSGRKLRGRGAAEIFTDYYKENSWENDESVSGDGSTLEYTENLRRELPRLLDRYRIASILDAPCGDYNWFRLVERNGIDYIGGDIVAQLTDNNQAKYADAHTRFIRLDIINDELPKADLWICRDVLFHFSFGDVFRTLQSFIQSDIRYILTTSHTKCAVNTDILTGQFRLLNLELSPFNLPKPLFAIDDWIEGFPERQMCLWAKEKVAEALKASQV